jgi:acyl carrier protein
MGLESVELVMAWEEHFGITIPDERAVTWQTPRIAILGIADLIQLQSPARKWTSEQIERDVCEIIVEQIGIKRSEFTLDSHFIRDMGID